MSPATVGGEPIKLYISLESGFGGAPSDPCCQTAPHLPVKKLLRISTFPQKMAKKKSIEVFLFSVALGKMPTRENLYPTKNTALNDIFLPFFKHLPFLSSFSYSRSPFKPSIRASKEALLPLHTEL
ncbi:hypothetical protein TNCV_2299771 [Trichonephila clavipes]|nr:hypothetical protein TNCV_2299771 [Trichonephila clavipes]